MSYRNTNWRDVEREQREAREREQARLERQNAEAAVQLAVLRHPGASDDEIEAKARKYRSKIDIHILVKKEMKERGLLAVEHRFDRPILLP